MTAEQSPTARHPAAAVLEPAAASASPQQFAGWLPPALAVGAFFALWPTALSLLSEWNDESHDTTYTHGYLVAGICVWLLVRSRTRLHNLRLAPDPRALIALLAAAFTWVVAVRGGIQTVHQLLMPVIIWLLVWVALGWRAAWASSFGIAYLYFAVPLWGHVNTLLQDGTAYAIDIALRITGITTYVEGNLIHLPAGVMEIAGGCSGLHFFIVALAIAALYGELNDDPWRLRLKQLALAIGLAIVTNWVRVYTIVIAGYLTDMQHYLVRVSHYGFGWFVFAVAMAIFFGIARRMEAPEQVRKETTPSAGGSVVNLPLGVTMAIAGLVAGPLWNALVTRAHAQPQHVQVVLPAELSAWAGPSAAVGSEWKPAFVGADADAHGIYSQAGQSVELYVAVYATQTQGKELVGYSNSITGSSRDSVEAQTSMAPEGKPAVELLVRQPDGQQYLLWYFYQVGALRTANGVAAQLWYGVSSVASAPQSRVVALRAACGSDCEAARTALGSFLESSGL